MASRVLWVQVLILVSLVHFSSSGCSKSSTVTDPVTTEPIAEEFDGGQESSGTEAVDGGSADDTSVNREEEEPVTRAPDDSRPAGLFISRSDFQALRNALNEGVEPFYSNCQTLASRADAALSVEADPFYMDDLLSIRFGWCEDPDGVDDTLRELTKKLERQTDYMRTLALYCAISGEQQYGDHAVKMLLDWANGTTLVNMYDFNIDFVNSTFDGQTDDGYCGVRPYNFALDSIWQSYGLINVSDAYILLTRNGYPMSAEDDATIREWILELTEATNSGFHAWTRWADQHTSSSSYRSHRSDNHLSWSLAGILAGAAALEDDALAGYCLDGGSWTDSQAGAYTNPSSIREVIDWAIESGTGEENEGRMHEERIHRSPPIRYSLFHLWAMTLVAWQAQVHFGQDVWEYKGTDGAGLKLAFERYAAFVLGERESTESEGNLNFYRWLWEAAYSRWPESRFRDVIDSGPRDTILVQSFGPVVLMLGVKELGAEETQTEELVTEEVDAVAAEPTEEAAAEPVLDAEPTPEAPLESESFGEKTSVSQFGITWTFDGVYQVGQFANGDYWVIGPARVVSVSPAPIGSGSGLRHGSVVNPPGGDFQGYDGRVNGYDGSLTVRFPMTLQPSQSLVSTVSWLEGEPDIPPTDSSGAPRPALKTAAVLTCLESVPPKGSFRPACAGRNKKLYNIAQLQRDILPQLPPVPATPGLNTAEQWFARVWLDTKMGWSGRNAHPSFNMPDYGRDISARIHDGILMLLLDVPEKETLLIRVVQVGIDFYGVLEDGGYWGTIGGGHGVGRKWPILFAGIMLNDEAMMNIGFTYGPEKFQEDCQTFYVTQEDKNRFPDLFPVVGAPAWGSRHCNRPHEDDMWRGYRVCCTANSWGGAVLAARILGAEELWNHDVIFEYQDLYMPELAESHGVGDSRRSWTDFAEEMWDTYRASY